LEILENWKLEYFGNLEKLENYRIFYFCKILKVWIFANPGKTGNCNILQILENWKL
jgi:hypothetical protein